MTEASIGEVTEATLLRWNAPGGEVRVHSFVSKAEAGVYVAGIIAGALQGAIAERGQAVWVGCGGTTPKPIYESLTGLDLDWGKITLAQVDERWVATDDA
ncbi:MAG: 6-phosphogluconolactonase, partial [Asticcacaulis sp.]|nr:6-phosphogluconolactonase [Asticcacaulis sp.]